ncbi:MAG: hypothetical protein ACLP8S_10315 [Solirubrobacteraceae bacterium]
MTVYGEWTCKGATLSDTTARKEYGVDEDFIVKGVKVGKLEYRNGEMYGSPYIKVLRRQLEGYIAQELGDEYLRDWKDKTELRKIKRDMAALRKQLAELDARKMEIESRRS